ncbi:cysteine hydrolase family protein [Bacillus sp. JJ1764]|uniref:cysteine hydrolase family protein n=1 Tax=Bacillus sp. JJ1764 TaxID=3122964 RepID=UPI002FFE68EA
MSEKKSALLVIDPQVGPLYGTYQKEETLSVMLKLIGRAEKEKIPVFFIQHEEQPGGFLQRGTRFWQFVEGIQPKPGDTIIPKSGTDAFYETTLQQELKAREINHLVVVGVRTEYCVDTTCRSAVTLGFDVTLVSDGHTTADGAIPAELIIKHHNHNLYTVKTIHHHITVTPSEDVQFS